MSAATLQRRKKNRSSIDRAALTTHDMFKPVFRRQLQADAVAPRELQWRACAPGVIDRTDGVYDVLPGGR